MIDKNTVCGEIEDIRNFMSMTKCSVRSARQVLLDGGKMATTASGLYDASCLLEVIESDDKLLWILAYYYGNSQELP
jgi:hypothetical protein